MAFINNNGEDDTTGEEIGEILRKVPMPDYPRDLKTATKAEYMTLAKKMGQDKKKGCPFAILIILIKVMSFVGLTQLIS